MLRKVLLITDMTFWNRSAGGQNRVWEIVKYLGSISLLTVVYVGIEGTGFVRSKDLAHMNFFSLNNEEILSAEEYGEIFEKFLYGKTFDVWIIEYIHNAHFMNYLPEGVLTILDAHDIVSERSKGFKNYNYGREIFEMDEDTEFEILDIFDYIIYLTKNDFLYTKQKIDEKKILVCPHPVKIKKPRLKREVRNVGFIGSEYGPNIDALEYFVKNCWPGIIKKYPDLKFTIYGNVVKRIHDHKLMNSQNISLAGFVEDLDKAYRDIDIIVNPVRFGAGLKIKNVEALAKGLPLITTPHGARGLEEIQNSGFLVAETPEDFLDCFSKLIEDFSFREEISRNAILFAGKNFEVEKCFYNLKELIYQEVN